MVIVVWMKALSAKMTPLNKVLAPLWAAQCVFREDEGGGEGERERMEGQEGSALLW